METPKNPQEMNENLDRIQPEWTCQYALIITERGSVTWYENHDSAVRDQSQYGGFIVNTSTADPEFVKRCVDNALRNIL